MGNATKAARIEIRKVRLCEWASEETTCFEAEVWADGRRVGYVSNEGRGGAHSASRDVPGIVGDYAATLPPRPWGFVEGTYQPTWETVIDDLLEEYLRRREAGKLLRKCKKNVVYFMDGDFWTQKPTSLGVGHAIEYVAGKYGDKAKILNGMDSGDAEAFIMEVLS